MRGASDEEDQAASMDVADNAEGGDREARFGILPTLRGDDDDEEETATPVQRREPPLAPMPRVQPSATAPAPPPLSRATPTAALPRDDLRKLQTALHELGECRKLLDAAINEGA